MACSTCKTSNCGCTGTYVVSATCPPSCSEVFNSQCIVYTGVDILCGTDTVIARNDYLDTVITKLTNYICTKLIALDNYGIFTITDTDSGYTWSNIGSAAATDPADTFTFVSGEGINLDVDSTLLAMRVSFSGLTIGAGLSGAGTAASPLVNSAFIWTQFVSDSGNTTASTTADVLTVAGGTGISTAIAGDTLTITNDANKWARFDADSGTTTANAVADILTVAGGTGITTSISGDTLTIVNDSPGTAVALTSVGSGNTLVNDGTGPALAVKSIVQGAGISMLSSGTELSISADVTKFNGPASTAAPGSGGTVSVAHNLNKAVVAVTLREAAVGGVGYYAGVDYSITYTDNNNLVITDIGGGITGAFTYSVMG